MGFPSLVVRFDGVNFSDDALAISAVLTFAPCLAAIMESVGSTVSFTPANSIKRATSTDLYRSFIA
jgi:hypothetical protein